MGNIRGMGLKIQAGCRGAGYAMGADGCQRVPEELANMVLMATEGVANTVSMKGRVLNALNWLCRLLDVPKI